jgi:hypothetical protein
MMMAQPPNASGIEPTKLMLKGNESNVVLSNQGKLRSVLKDFGGNTNPGNLKALIQQIRASNEIGGVDVPGLTGLGGGYGHAFLDLAGEALDNQGARVVVSLSGQILDYEFTTTIDDDTGVGRLEVVTYITSRVVPSGMGVPPAKTDAYRWKIHVIDDGFTVVHRDDGASDGPFPGTIPFNQEMKDRIDSLGFTRKLWVKGEKIVIDEIWLDKNYDATNPDFVQLSSTDPKYAKLFVSDENSCIDMMFVGQPPEEFDDLLAPPFYCLGRCENPWIINTK